MSEIAHVRPLRIAGFDGLRAIAFLLVFVSHKLATGKTEMYGDLGVWLFFLLSGFLITRIVRGLATAVERGETTYWQAVGEILLRRSVRILPAYYALLTALVPVSLFVTINHFSWPEQMAYWSHTVNFYVAQHGWVGRFGHFWSLSIEVQYYAVFAIAALAVSGSRTWVICAIFLLWGAVTNVVLVRADASTIVLDVHSALGFGLFGLGGLCGLLADGEMARRLTRPAAIVAAFALYLAVPLLVTSYEQFVSFGRVSAIPVAVLLVAVYRNQGCAIVQALEWRPLRLLGMISYGAYLFHQFVSLSFIEAIVLSITSLPVIAVLARLGAELTITIAISAISWRVLEKPAIDWGKRMALRRVHRPSDTGGIHH